MPQTLELTRHANGSVTNKTGNDPSIDRVTGYEKYWMGADLGQANDLTAVVAIKDTRLPMMIGNKIQLGPRERVVSYADSFRGVSYVDVVAHLIRLKNAEPFAGKTELVIDGTSIGRVVSDMLEEQNVPHTAVQFTAGQDWSRKGRYVNASKTLMIENTSVLFSSGELKFAHDLPMRKQIEDDLGTFSLQTTKSGNQIITQSRNASGHGDAGIGLIISAFASQYLVPGFVGASKLEGYW